MSLFFKLIHREIVLIIIFLFLHRVVNAMARVICCADLRKIPFVCVYFCIKRLLFTVQTLDFLQGSLGCQLSYRGRRCQQFIFQRRYVWADRELFPFL